MTKQLECLFVLIDKSPRKLSNQFTLLYIYRAGHFLLRTKLICKHSLFKKTSSLQRPFHSYTYHCILPATRVGGWDLSSFLY